MTPEEAYAAKSDEATARLLIDQALFEAWEARHDIVKFFEFVMLEQTTKQPLKAAPHQRVGLKFMMDHDRSANLWPVGHTKTMSTECVALFLMGQDVTMRGAIVSASEGQAEKPLKVISDYITTSGKLRMVFKNMKPSTRPGDKWSQTSIVLDRPPGIPDPTLSAYGLDTKRILGSRLNWVLLDDLLNEENTRTKDARDKTYRALDVSVLSRLDPRNGRVIFTNTAFHPDDAIHMVEKLGWPTLRMDIYGNIKIQDDLDSIRDGGKFWEHPELRPASSSPREECYRLRAHDPDPKNEIPLWPERFFYEQPGSRVAPAKTMEEATEMAHKHIDFLRSSHLPQVFSQMYLNECRDDGSSMCKLEWITRCKERARSMNHLSMVSEYRGPNPTFTGVDLAFAKGSHADFTAFFTFEALPNGLRRILDIEIGQWDGPEIARIAALKVARYNSILRVEDNAGQTLLIQFAREKDISLPVKAHRTGKNKWSPDFGVQSVFLDMYNGAWLIPNDRQGRCHPHVQKWIDECLYFVPGQHSGDALMASWFAREQAREWGALVVDTGGGQQQGSIAMGIMSR